MNGSLLAAFRHAGMGLLAGSVPAGKVLMSRCVRVRSVEVQEGFMVLLLKKKRMEFKTGWLAYCKASLARFVNSTRWLTVRVQYYNNNTKMLIKGKI